MTPESKRRQSRPKCAASSPTIRIRPLEGEPVSRGLTRLCPRAAYPAQAWQKSHTASTPPPHQSDTQSQADRPPRRASSSVIRPLALGRASLAARLRASRLVDSTLVGARILVPTALPRLRAATITGATPSRRTGGLTCQLPPAITPHLAWASRASGTPRLAHARRNTARRTAVPTTRTRPRTGPPARVRKLRVAAAA